jgi:hypothetical protein
MGSLRSSMSQLNIAEEPASTAISGRALGTGQSWLGTCYNPRNPAPDRNDAAKAMLLKQ